MTRKKFAFAFNLITVLAELSAYAEIKASRKRLKKRYQSLLIYYTQLSNIVALISTFLYLISGRRSPKEWITWLRYLSCCMLLMTFTVVMLVLIPMGGSPQKLLFEHHSFVHHVLAPIMTVASFLLCEEQPKNKKAFWLPIVVTEIYGIVMLVFNAIGKVKGPYPFFRVKQQGVPKTILWMMVLTIVIGADAKLMLGK